MAKGKGKDKPAESFIEAKRKHARKVSPAEKRAEVAKQREEWSNQEIDRAFLEAGGIPKSADPEAPKKAGRPSKYTGDLALARRCGEAGLTDAQTAKVFGVVESTINLWKVNHPEFAEALNAGKDCADDKVERSLFERATGYSHPEEKLFFDSQVGRVVRADTIKVYPPDPTSMIFWLKNRRPKQWREAVQLGTDDRLSALIEHVTNRRKADAVPPQ